MRASTNHLGAAMDLRQLRYFIAIASAESLSRASVSVGVTQSALTRQLQLLEEELGLPLLRRTGHGVTLTEAGDRFLVSATDVVDRADAAVRDMQALRKTTTGSVVLGIPPMLAETLLVPLVTRFRQDFPDVSLRVRDAISGYVLEWLITGQVDVAVVYNAPKRAKLALETLISDELMLVGAAGQGAVQSDAPIDLAEALKLPLVLPSPQHGLRDVIDTAAASISVQPNIALEVEGIHSLIRFAEEGYAYTFLPFGSVSYHVAQGLLGARPIINPSVPSVLSVAMSTLRPATKAMKQLFRYIREDVARLLETEVWQHRKPPSEPPATDPR
ncbi:LysR substrate-binding domain-containing protein [Variovorax humicola]|uniref:LysR substrate-binding domain-containing protein n=1 Tax=Variovorax humicola TaxID=1769758 RepID=A0ABU8VXM2_9BURK